MLALSGAMLTAPRAEAQTTFAQLGWNSSMTMVCVTAGCTTIDFTLSLSGLQPFENNGPAVPGPVLAIPTPGYPNFFQILLNSGPGVFTSATVTSGGTWVVGFSSSSEAQVQLLTPYTGAPVTVRATFSLPGTYGFSYSGLAYIGANAECYDATGASVSCGTAGKLYQQGDYNGAVTAIPEPMSMTLLGTGLIGLGLVGIRRRKKNAAK
jgi:hypothetical protein